MQAATMAAAQSATEAATQVAREIATQASRVPGRPDEEAISKKLRELEYKSKETDLKCRHHELQRRGDVLKSEGNRNQFRSFVAVRIQIVEAVAMLDEMQIEDGDTESSVYIAIAAVKRKHDEALKSIDERLFLIEKADADKHGWPKVNVYEKLKVDPSMSDAEKRWKEADKQVDAVKKASEADTKKGYKATSKSYTPFHSRPAGYAGYYPGMVSYPSAAAYQAAAGHSNQMGFSYPSTQRG